LPNEFKLACAGAGKTTSLVEDALAAARENRPVLIVTYTRNNQAEILDKIKSKNTTIPDNIKVKGWFTFLLEDIIRPYQTCFFSERVEGIIFNTTDPHRRNNRAIPGRKETVDGNKNIAHYFSSNRAYTHYISKLAANICKAGKVGRGKTATYSVMERLTAIYDLLIIDEVQDLAGWDYDILDYVCKTDGIDLCCVGDFRQTVYQTSHPTKTPKSSDHKKQWFETRSFVPDDLNRSWRCVRQICEFADKVHAHKNYAGTESNLEENPAEAANHIGVFCVREHNITEYMERYDPVILRYASSVRPDLCEGRTVLSFGKSKGLGFKRVLILPTQKQVDFLNGNIDPLLEAKTEEALNKLYVAITRARYSVAFLTDHAPTIGGIGVWIP